jgi:proteasome beta subunit
MALGILDQQYKNELTETQATDLAVKSIRAASMRDSASGDNIDVLVINKDGITETAEKIT